MRSCPDKKGIGTYQVHADPINEDIEPTDGDDVWEIIGVAPNYRFGIVVYLLN
jgi:hypothetical protein